MKCQDCGVDFNRTLLMCLAVGAGAQTIDPNYCSISPDHQHTWVAKVVYGVIPSSHMRNEYCVAVSQDGGRFRPIGSIRNFDTFEAACECAKEVAAGKYPDLAPAGDYITMR